MSTPEVQLVASRADIEIGAEGYGEILQNVRIIVTTRKGSVPLDREFGVDWNVVDQPTPKARAALVADVFRAVSKHEPRARVTEVEWMEDTADAAEGRLVPRIRLEILA